MLAERQGADLSLAPTELNGPTNLIIREVTGVADPYAKHKNDATRADAVAAGLDQVACSTPISKG